MLFSYYSILNRGVRIASRSKVNDSMITGLRIVDSILPVGRGQRQLIPGDRYTGKTSVFLSSLLYSSYLTLSCSMEGLGTKRVFGIYIGINQNPSKLSKLINVLSNNGSISLLWLCLLILPLHHYYLIVNL